MEFSERVISTYPYLKIDRTNDVIACSGWHWNPELEVWKITVHDPFTTIIVDNPKESDMAAIPIADFEELMEAELSKGDDKYGEGNTTLEFVRGIDPNFELGAIAKYISRIAHGDSRSETDIVKVATYAYLYWLRHYHASPDRKNT